MPKPRSFRVILIRSGSTEWDLSGRLSGSADHPMCAAGAESLAETIRGLNLGEVASVLHGPDEASTASAAIIADLSRTKARSKDGLAEVNLGLWEGLLPSDLEERHPTVYARWLEDPSSVSVPEGEPLAEAEERIVGAFLKATEKVAHEATVVVVLRPMAWALMRNRLLGRLLSETTVGLDGAGGVESLECRTADLEGSRLARSAAGA